jgi:phospholipid/cholesterol/gamma-HCH transport system permease protein
MPAGLAAGPARNREAAPPERAATADHIEVRRELRRQIGRLEAALAGHPPDLSQKDVPPSAGDATPRIADLDELERIRDAMIGRLSEVERAAEARARRTARARARRDALLRQPRQHRWQAVSSAEAGEAGCLEYRVEPRLGPLGMVLNWWRVVVSGGCPLAVPRGAAVAGGVRGAVSLPTVQAVQPLASFFTQVGSMMILTARTVGAAVLPEYPFGEELVGQFLFALKLCWFAMLVSTFALCLGAPGLQAANALSLFGALDRLGGFFVLAAIRQIAPIVTAVIVAGVAGTAITADLGARKIREELDALQVLGVDPIKNLVVPRFLALMLITGLLDLFAIVFGLAGGVVTELLYHQSLGGFFATLFSNASITDLWGSVVMCTLFGAIIAIVCSYKGMTASGGAAGVGRAVNQAVVISFLGVFAFNFVFTSVLLASHPELQSIR